MAFGLHPHTLCDLFGPERKEPLYLRTEADVRTNGGWEYFKTNPLTDALPELIPSASTVTVFGPLKSMVMSESAELLNVLLGPASKAATALATNRGTSSLYTLISRL